MNEYGNTMLKTMFTGRDIFVEELMNSGKYIPPAIKMEDYIFRVQNPLTTIPRILEDSDCYEKEKNRYKANMRLNTLEYGSKRGPEFIFDDHYREVDNDNFFKMEDIKRNQERTKKTRELLMGYSFKKPAKDVQSYTPEVIRIKNDLNDRIHDPLFKRFSTRLDPSEIITTDNRLTKYINKWDRVETIRNSNIQVRDQPEPAVFFSSSKKRQKPDNISKQRMIPKMNKFEIEMEKEAVNISKRSNKKRKLIIPAINNTDNLDIFEDVVEHVKKNPRPKVRTLLY
jgi:hypothetical protein